MGAMRQRSAALIVRGFAGKHVRFYRGALAVGALLYDIKLGIHGAQH